MGAWVLGAFAEERAMVEAARLLRGEGFVLMEAYTPFPSPDAYEVLPGKTRIPAVILLAALAGIAGAVWLQWFCNAVSFPINVGGRPLISLPVYVPIAFECAVLFGSFAGLYAFFVSCRLPRLDHPLQDSAVLERASVDRFVLAIRWERTTAGSHLERRMRELGADSVEEIRDP